MEFNWMMRGKKEIYRNVNKSEFRDVSRERATMNERLKKRKNWKSIEQSLKNIE